MVEQMVLPASSIEASVGTSSASRPRRLREIQGDEEDRLVLPISEFARALGGGIVPGSLTLVGGDPGIGKSTLLLQAALVLARQGSRVLYVSGEESEKQIRLRSLRLKASGSEFPEELFLVTETSLPAILHDVEIVSPRVLVVDSIQTVYRPELTSAAGSISQVRECAARLQVLAKSSGLAIFLIGHVTKEGTLAGPRVLEHLVDTVLYLEGDRFQSYRLLRCVKNRFGPTSEVGVFEMRSDGMMEVPNPSEAFLAERVFDAPGTAIAATMEGTRPLLVEMQALTSPAAFGNPRRTANGVDLYRLLLVAAVLIRRVGLKLGEQDIFVNVVGGLHVSEPAGDLAMAVAIASSIRDRPVPADLVMFGEVGLSGELRATSPIAARVREAAQLGFHRVLLPRLVRGGEVFPSSIQRLEARSVREAIDLALLEVRQASPGTP